MPGLMFQDVVCSRARADSKRYTVPLSLIVHTLVLAAIIVAPLIATTDLVPPARTKYVAPECPDVARNAGLQGVLILEAVIGADGKVQELRVLRWIPLFDDGARHRAVQTVLLACQRVPPVTPRPIFTPSRVAQALLAL